MHCQEELTTAVKQLHGLAVQSVVFLSQISLKLCTLLKNMQVFKTNILHQKTERERRYKEASALGHLGHSVLLQRLREKYQHLELMAVGDSSAPLV